MVEGSYGGFLTASVSANYASSLTESLSKTQGKEKAFTIQAGQSMAMWQLMVQWQVDGAHNSAYLDEYTYTSERDMAPPAPVHNSACTLTVHYQCVALGGIIPGSGSQRSFMVVAVACLMPLLMV